MAGLTWVLAIGFPICRPCTLHTYHSHSTQLKCTKCKWLVPYFMFRNVGREWLIKNQASQIWNSRANLEKIRTNGLSAIPSLRAALLTYETHCLSLKFIRRESIVKCTEVMLKWALLQSVYFQQQWKHSGTIHQRLDNQSLKEHKFKIIDKFWLH